MPKAKATGDLFVTARIALPDGSDAELEGSCRNGVASTSAIRAERTETGGKCCRNSRKYDIYRADEQQNRQITQVARLEKQKDCVHRRRQDALADYEAGAVAVRKNMERLRALRLAKEAEDAARTPASVPVKRRAAAKGAKSTGEAEAAPLSEWLVSQRNSGRLR